MSSRLSQPGNNGGNGGGNRWIIGRETWRWPLLANVGAAASKAKHQGCLLLRCRSAPHPSNNLQQQSHQHQPS